MDPNFSGHEESKDQVSQNENQNNNNQRDPNEILAELVKFIDETFEPKNIVNNYYLTNKAKDTTFEIPVNFLYEENTIKSITQDRGLIDQAFAQCKNILVIKRTGKIEGIRPRNLESKTEISIKNVAYNEQDGIKKFVDEITNTNSNINFNYKSAMNIVTLSCGDEQLASETFSKIRQSPYKGNLLECSLDSVNLYISALENTRNRKKSSNYQPKFNPYYAYNPYQNYYPPQYMGYGKYNNYNPNYGNPGNSNGYGNYNDGDGHNKGGKKPYKKGYNNKYKNNQYNKEPKHFDEDKDFPPLPNEKEGNQ